MTDKERAEAYRLAVEYLDEITGNYHAQLALTKEADRIDPPYKLDRSLWGWVLVTYDNGAQQVQFAASEGLRISDDNSDSVISWHEVEFYGWKVEKLNIVQPGQVAVQIHALGRCLELARSCSPTDVLHHPDDGRRLQYIQDQITQAERMEAQDD